VGVGGFEVMKFNEPGRGIPARYAAKHPLHGPIPALPGLSHYASGRHSFLSSSSGDAENHQSLFRAIQELTTPALA